MSSQCDGTLSTVPVQGGEACTETTGDLLSQSSTAAEPAPNHAEVARDVGHSQGGQPSGSKDQRISLDGLFSGEPGWAHTLPTPAPQLLAGYQDHCGDESGINAMGMASGSCPTSMVLPASGDFGPSSAAGLLNKVRQKIVSNNNLPAHGSTCNTEHSTDDPDQRYVFTDF
jgi:hypothetical protein